MNRTQTARILPAPTHRFSVYGPRSRKELEKAGRYYRNECFGHGRIEIREYYIENDAEWLKERHLFFHLHAVDQGKARFQMTMRLPGYFEKEVFTRSRKELEKAGRYYRNECFGHGRIDHIFSFCLPFPFYSFFPVLID